MENAEMNKDESRLATPRLTKMMAEAGYSSKQMDDLNRLRSMATAMRYGQQTKMLSSTSDIDQKQVMSFAKKMVAKRLSGKEDIFNKIIFPKAGFSTE